MVRKDGKVYSTVAKLLRAKGYDTKTLAIATMGPGPYHMVVLHDRVIGGYNHRSRQLSLNSTPDECNKNT